MQTRIKTRFYKTLSVGTCLAIISIYHPIAGARFLGVVIFLSRSGHMAIWFIQLELVSMLAVYLLFVEGARSGVPVFFIIALFTTLASEGAVGLTIIVSNRRRVVGELLKRKF